MNVETHAPFWGWRSGPHFHDAAGTSRPIWIVPARLCVAGFVIDPRHVRPDGSIASTESVARSLNTVFGTVKRFIEKPRLMVGPGPVDLGETKPIMYGEELFIYYGSEYKFWR